MDTHLTPRHVRHRKRSHKRPKRARDFYKFLNDNAVRLNGTGAAFNFTSAAANAVGTLTASAIANADTVTINGRTYTFQDVLTNVNGNVKRAGVLATDLATLAKAINLTGIAGTDYAAATTANADVSATATATTLVARALTAGTAQNAFATTKVGTGLSWGAGTLLGGLAASANLSATAHGLVPGQGPFLLTNVGGVVPTPLVLNTRLYWVTTVPDANTFTLSTRRRNAPVPLVFTSGGTGTNTLTKASSIEAILAYLRRVGGRRLKATADVDLL